MCMNNIVLGNDSHNADATIITNGLQANATLLKDDLITGGNNALNRKQKKINLNNNQENRLKAMLKERPVVSFSNDFINEVKTELSSVEGYGLNDLNQANLMSRVDSKFLLPIRLLPKVLAQLQQHYRVLDINEQRISTYFNQSQNQQDILANTKSKKVLHEFHF